MPWAQTEYEFLFVDWRPKSDPFCLVGDRNHLVFQEEVKLYPSGRLCCQTHSAPSVVRETWGGAWRNIASPLKLSELPDATAWTVGQPFRLWRVITGDRHNSKAYSQPLSLVVNRPLCKRQLPSLHCRQLPCVQLHFSMGNFRHFCEIKSWCKSLACFSVLVWWLLLLFGDCFYGLVIAFWIIEKATSGCFLGTFIWISFLAN